MTKEDLLWLDEPEPGWKIASLPFLALEDTFVSGDPSGRRLQVRYYLCGPQRALCAKVMSGEAAQGPPGHVHGGGQAAILDEAMGGAAWLAGHPVVAARLELDFRAMLPIGTRALVHAEVTGVVGRKVQTSAQLTDVTGTQIFSRGTGLFIALDQEQIDRLPRAAAEIVAQARAGKFPSSG